MHAQRYAAAGHFASSAEVFRRTSLQGAFFSNELVDALPVHRVGNGGRSDERSLSSISATGSSRTFVAPVFDLRDHRIFCGAKALLWSKVSTPRSGAGSVRLDHGKLGRRLERGYVLTIDYGPSRSGPF